jgi:hypothetical protein
MRKSIFYLTALVCSAFCPNQFVIAQENPVEHMNALGNREELLSQKYMSYMSEVAHGSRARKMEKRREDLINSVKESIKEANKLRPFKGDASLRDAYKEYWSVLLSVFTEQYHKIVDMEEVAEQSYDAMEAYLLIQEKATKTLDDAYSNIPVVYEAFANRHNVKLIEGQKSKLARKLDQTSAVNGYVNTLYLIFFKSYVQEGQMLKGLNANDINAIEQSKGSMAKFAAEGLAKLDTLKPFKGDGSLITACRKVLEFNKSEAEKFSTMTNYLIKFEEFQKMKKTYEAKPANKRTQADVDAFNKAGTEYNSTANSFNKLNEELNNGRSKVLDNWNKARQRFMDSHVPHK